MNTEHDPIAERLHALYAEYKKQLPDRVTQIEAQFEAFVTDPSNISRLNDLVFSLHKLAGSGATFGFEEITQISRQWERLVQPKIKTTPVISSAELSEMRRLLNDLRTAVAIARNSNF